MAKINQMGEHQNPMASIKRVSASKHMQYEAVLRNLGKKMFYRAAPTLFEDKPAQKKIRQTDTSNLQQSSAGTEGGIGGDLPMAMKYRLSKT